MKPICCYSGHVRAPLDNTCIHCGSVMGIKPQWHGNDFAEAQARARLIGGVILWSAPPHANLTAPKVVWGYWSEAAGCMVREMQGECIVKRRVITRA